MNIHANDAEASLKLRLRALSRLAGGKPNTDSGTSPAPALAVLHALASTPATAGDALALLHELQLHQVELELQHEELRRGRSELEAGLKRQTALVDHAPVAYLTIDAALRLHELNHAAARLLGGERADLYGERLTRFLSPHSAVVLSTLLGRVDGGAAPQRCALRRTAAETDAPALLAVVSPDPAGGRYLVALVEPDARDDAPA